jgi:hypothetical protein
MKILLKIFFAFYAHHCFAICEFKSDVKNVISLSGSTTVILKELGLLSNPKLAGISVFNPVNEKAFKGKIYPGGVFLSQNTLSSFVGSVVLYDESRELAKMLTSEKKIISREVKTRNQTPGESIEFSINVLKEFLNGCGTQINKLRSKAQQLEQTILEKLPQPFSVIVFLGEFHNARMPEIVIVNDGVVKWLIDKKRIQSYPSELAYVNWSAKILNSFSSKTIFLGVKDSGNKLQKEIKKSSNRVTLIYPGSLVPGLSQLEAFQYLAENL